MEELQAFPGPLARYATPAGLGDESSWLCWHGWPGSTSPLEGDVSSGQNLGSPWFWEIRAKAESGFRSGIHLLCCGIDWFGLLEIGVFLLFIGCGLSLVCICDLIS